MREEHTHALFLGYPQLVSSKRLIPDPAGASALDGKRLEVRGSESRLSEMCNRLESCGREELDGDAIGIEDADIRILLRHDAVSEGSVWAVADDVLRHTLAISLEHKLALLVRFGTIVARHSDDITHTVGDEQSTADKVGQVSRYEVFRLGGKFSQKACVDAVSDTDCDDADSSVRDGGNERLDW